MWYKIVLNELTLKVLWWGIVTLIVLWEARWLSHSQAASSQTWIPAQTPLDFKSWVPEMSSSDVVCQDLPGPQERQSITVLKRRVKTYWGVISAYLGVSQRHGMAGRGRTQISVCQARPLQASPYTSMTSKSESVCITDDVLLGCLSNITNQMRPWTQTAWGPLCESRKTLKVKGFPLVFCPQHLTWWAWSTGPSAVGATCHLIVWDHHRQDSLKYSKC